MDAEEIRREPFPSLGIPSKTRKKNDRLSLATFRPPLVKTIIAEERERERDAGKLQKALDRIRQETLFDSDSEREFRKVFQPTQKIPYRFKYAFGDDSGAETRSMVEDWEIGTLFLHCRESEASESVAVEKTIRKYMGFVEKIDFFSFWARRRNGATARQIRSLLSAFIRADRRKEDARNKSELVRFFLTEVEEIYPIDR